jgi:hypothetical protein
VTNVDAIKAYIRDGLGMGAAIQRRGGDKVLLQSAEVEEWPATVAAYKQQWAGPVDYAIFDETADNPRMARMFNLFRQGDFSKGMEPYWELAPITIGAGGAMLPSGMMGVKCIQWSAGGNGGMYGQPELPIFQRRKDAMRTGLKAAGITPREPDEEFYVGRLNYAKGAGLKYWTAPAHLK